MLLSVEKETFKQLFMSKFKKDKISETNGFLYPEVMKVEAIIFIMELRCNELGLYKIHILKL